MKALTINQLFEILAQAKKDGLGKKKIMVSADDEGNEYHELFFGVTENVEELFAGEYAPFLPYGVTKENLKDYVVIG